MVAVVLLLFALSFVAYMNEDPDKMLAPLGYIIYFSGAVICGLISAVDSANNKTITGALSGTLYTALLWLISMIFESTDISGSVLRRIFFYVGGIASAMLVSGTIGRIRQKGAKKTSMGKLRKNTLKRMSKAKM